MDSTPDVRAEFLTECRETLASVESDLLGLERNPDDQERVRRAFRSFHTLKGTCGFLQVSRLERLAHVSEEVLTQIRDGTLPVSSSVIGPLLGAVDKMKEVFSAIESGGEEPVGDDTPLLSELESVGQPTATPAADARKAGRTRSATDGNGGCADPAPGGIGGTVGTEAERKGGGKQEETAPEEAGTPRPRGADQSLRVNVDILDRLMNMVGELVLTRNQLVQMVQAEDESRYAAPIQHLNRVTSGLQEAVMKTRMQPIGNAWTKLPRLVRDLAQATGKQIHLVMEGSETEVDRQILQAVQDPLIHLVRNAADHGIEPPAARWAAGKPAEGTVALDARHEGGHIVIEVRDDGAGIPLDRIREKAVQKGLIRGEDLGDWTEARLLQLLFEPGFSTAERVTEVSGRGVGMDVVKTSIEKIGGSVDLASKPGEGTTVHIKIPLTLAIIPALVVGAGGEAFAIPQVSVVELVGLSEDNRGLIDHVHGSKVFRLRDRLLPLVDLAQILGLTNAPDHKVNFVVVAQGGGSRFGLCVDEIFDTQEIVVKPAGRLVRDVALFAGTTILGDGRVIMILDVSGVARKAQAFREEEAHDESRISEAADRGEATSLLLFRNGAKTPMAVPLALVARLEEFPLGRFEDASGRKVVQYRESLLPLVPCGSQDGDDMLSGMPDPCPVIVFSDGRRSMGILVTEILDIVEERVRIDAAGGRAGILGAAIVRNEATEILDIYHFTQRAYPDWFACKGRGGGGGTRVLVVDDSSFFRGMLRLLLAAEGCEVTLATDGADALAQLKRGEPFDVILSDIDMPVMDGLEFAKTVRREPAWKDIPLLALTSLAGERDRRLGIEAGYSEYLIKFDRDAVLASIQSISAKRLPAAKQAGSGAPA